MLETQKGLYLFLAFLAVLTALMVVSARNQEQRLQMLQEAVLTVCPEESEL